ncbi:MAG: FecR domain-containing protein [Pseudomonadota bacterium]
MTNTKHDDRALILEEAHKWHALLSDPEHTQLEERRFKRWLSEDKRHAEFYDYAVTMQAAFSRIEAEEFDLPVAAKTIPRKRENDHQRRRRDLAFGWIASIEHAVSEIKAPFYIASSLALAILIISALYFIPSTEDATSVARYIAEYQTEKGQTKAITLPDESVIRLGADSTIHTRFTATERTVSLLSGEAFFDVISDPDRPFKVEADQMRATVTGTEFNIHRRSRYVSLAIAEGSVTVDYGKKAELQLFAGQSVSATKTSGLSTIKTIPIQNVATWRSNRLLYNNASLEEIIYDANRYSTIPITISISPEKMQKIRIRGSFSASDINGMLTSISEVYSLTIDRSHPDIIKVIE